MGIEARLVVWNVSPETFVELRRQLEGSRARRSEPELTFAILAMQNDVRPSTGVISLENRSPEKYLAKLRTEVASINDR